MKKIMVTGSCGLIGSQTAKFFHSMGFEVFGVDDDSRASFFGGQASTSKVRHSLETMLNYKHVPFSILNLGEMERAVEEFRPDLIVHTAGQPSHDWAADNPFEDFDANARGTLNMLHAAKKHAPECVFIFTSTNKVYGDWPNRLSRYTEKETRWEPNDKVVAQFGFWERVSVDECKHSLFGVSKLYADIAVQEYARYFGMRTGVFRFGCVTGPGHMGVEKHGFLSHLFKCLKEGRKYTIYGFAGKQVRDNIHAFDAATAFYEFFLNPRAGEVYNIGGSWASNCSILEAIQLGECVTGKKLQVEIVGKPREGDHIWYVSDMRKFCSDYPGWKHSYSFSTIVEEMLAGGAA